MKTQDQIEQLARDYFAQCERECRTSPGLDEGILAAAGEALTGSETGRERPGARGLSLLRWAAVPSVAAIVVVTVLLVPQFSPRVWAIDQTIQALRAVKAVYLSGWCSYPGQPKRTFEMWARPSANNPAVSGDFKLLEGDNHVAIASEQENTTWVLEVRAPARGGTVVYVTAGLNRRTPLQTDRWFEQLKQEARNWHEDYRDDAQTGRRLAVVTCEGPMLNNARYWEFQFDVQTKLPVRARVWFNPDRQGEPHYDMAHFAYNPAWAEETFQPRIPAGAQVVDCRVMRSAIDPDAGLPVGTTEPHRACRLVVNAYWEAVMAQDWNRARQLRPLTDEAWHELVQFYRENPPSAPAEILFTEHVSDPGTLAEVGCQLELRDGRKVQSVVNVMLTRHNDGTATAVITGTLGGEFR